MIVLYTIANIVLRFVKYKTAPKIVHKQKQLSFLFLFPVVTKITPIYQISCCVKTTTHVAHIVLNFQTVYALLHRTKF